MGETVPPEARLYPARPLLAASVAVVRGGRVLLAARASEPMRGVYTLPGGLVEAGETLAEAALRELREEVGVAARIVAALAPLEIIAREADGRVRHHYVVHPHAAHWLSGEPSPGAEALDVRWVTRGEAADLPTTAGLDAVLEQAFGATARPADPAPAPPRTRPA